VLGAGRAGVREDPCIACELYVQQIGDRQAEFFDVLEREIVPRFA
jgi:hypothetical protein